MANVWIAHVVTANTVCRKIVKPKSVTVKKKEHNSQKQRIILIKKKERTSAHNVHAFFFTWRHISLIVSVSVVLVVHPYSPCVPLKMNRAKTGSSKMRSSTCVLLSVRIK